MNDATQLACKVSILICKCLVISWKFFYFPEWRRENASGRREQGDRPDNLFVCSSVMFIIQSFSATTTLVWNCFVHTDCHKILGTEKLLINQMSLLAISHWDCLSSSCKFILNTSIRVHIHAVDTWEISILE